MGFSMVLLLVCLFVAAFVDSTVRAQERKRKALERAQFRSGDGMRMVMQAGVHNDNA